MYSAKSSSGASKSADIETNPLALPNWGFRLAGETGTKGKVHRRVAMKKFMTIVLAAALVFASLAWRRIRRYGLGAGVSARGGR